MHDYSAKTWIPHWFIFFYLHTTIRRKYMVLFHLFFFSAPPLNQKLGSSLINLFYLYTTIPAKVNVLIDFFYLHTTICTRLSFIYYYLFCTTTWSKIRVFINLHDHSTKVRGNAYSLIHSFLNGANFMFFIFMADTVLIFRSLCFWQYCLISY